MILPSAVAATSHSLTSGGIAAVTVNDVPLDTIPVTPVSVGGATLAYSIHLRSAMDELLLRIPLHSAADTASFHSALAELTRALPTEADSRRLAADGELGAESEAAGGTCLH